MASKLWLPESDDCAGLSRSIQWRPCRPFRKDRALAEQISLLVCGRTAAYAGSAASLETH